MKYGARQKLTRLITQSQSYALRVLYDTYDLRLFCFLGTTDQQEARLSETDSHEKRKSNDHYYDQCMQWNDNLQGSES